MVMKKSGSDVYADLDLKGKIESASPLQLVQMLFEGLYQSLLVIERTLQEGDLAGKARAMTKALAILAGLKSALDTSVDSDLPHNLAMLYDYLQQQLLEVNRTLDTRLLAELQELVLTLRQGWDGLSAEPSDGDYR